jgi:ribosomal subunit interface protein
MQVPLHVTFRGFPSSEAIEARISGRVGKLERLCERITSCRVVIESPHHHQQKGNTYRVSIDLTVPDGEIVVGRHNGRNHAHEDVYVAIRDAFDALERKLQDHVRRQRGDIKHHEPKRDAQRQGGGPG